MPFSNCKGGPVKISHGKPKKVVFYKCVLRYKSYAANGCTIKEEHMSDLDHPFSPNQLTNLVEYGMKSDHASAFTDWLWDWLYDNVPPKKRWARIHILDKMGYARTDGARHLFGDVLEKIARTGGMQDCWSKDEAYKYMGKPVRVWRNPGGDERTDFVHPPRTYRKR